MTAVSSVSIEQLRQDRTFLQGIIDDKLRVDENEERSKKVSEILLRLSSVGNRRGGATRGMLQELQSFFPLEEDQKQSSTAKKAEVISVLLESLTQGTQNEEPEGSDVGLSTGNDTPGGPPPEG